MKIITVLVGCSLLSVILAGCGPELAQTPLGTEEQNWQRTIKGSYSSWQPPRVAPPAIHDNMSKDYVPAPEVPAANIEVTDTEVVTPTMASEDVTVTEKDAKGDVVAQETVTTTEKVEKAAAPAGSSYTVVKGDTLSLISQKVYKDGRKWNRILKANDALLKGNANKLKPGMKLVIPAP